jgi:hypothetical protein
MLLAEKSTRWWGLADLLTFGRIHKSARFFIDYHSEFVLQHGPEHTPGI